MAYTTIDDPSVHFQAGLYTSNTSAEVACTFDGNSAMQPDLVILKRTNANGDSHLWYSSPIGVGKLLESDNTGAEESLTSLTAFGSDGFTLAADTSGRFNSDGDNFVAFGWKGSGTGSANEDGSTNTTATSANTTAKFSIGLYTGTGSAGMTVGHGLGVAPEWIIVKKRGGGDRWCVYHHKNTSAPETEAMYLDADSATADDADTFNDTAPTSTVVEFGDKGDINSAVTTVMWTWASVQGYSKMGSYIGTAAADGPFVWTGFRPAFIMLKNTNDGSTWMITDHKRSGYNPHNNRTYFNTTGGQEADTDRFDILSNGFKILKSDNDVNGSGHIFIYTAWAYQPFVNSNGVPCNAR